jgi:hypothetical protein
LNLASFICDLKVSFFIAKQGDERRLFIVPDTFIFVAQQGDMTNSVILRLPILISTPPTGIKAEGNNGGCLKVRQPSIVPPSLLLNPTR